MTSRESESRVELPQRVATEHLPNLIRVHPKVMSGGLPVGDEAFAELQSLGVKTVISVDGMKPDVESAAKHGLRYVHLPHGYDGVPDERIKELAKAVRELDGPIYIHCHHGKHRSPAAASVACVTAGMVPKSNALKILELAGTSPHYRGLYDSARDAAPLESALLNELKVNFREIAEVPPLAKAMVDMENTQHHLKLISEAGWRAPPEHPDLDPAHEALLMRELFTELLRSESIQKQPEGYLRYMRESESAARQLEDALRTWKPETATQSPPEIVHRMEMKISENCTACHKQFRDIPLSEK